PSARLLNGSRLGSRGRVAVALADPRPYATMQQLYAEIALIDGLLTPRGGFAAYLSRQIAPSAEVIQDHANKSSGGHTTPPRGSAARTPQPTEAPPLDLAVIVPAHDEKAVIDETLASLASCEYPAARRRTIVIADNCGDGTAGRAREHGVEVWERTDPGNRGK